MNSQFRKGILELCILDQISKGDCYGYQLVEQISQFIDISEGTIYPILRRLTKDQLCKTYLKESSGGPPRKYYQLTALGQTTYDSQMEQWLSFQKSIKQLLGKGDRNESVGISQSPSPRPS